MVPLLRRPISLNVAQGSSDLIFAVIAFAILGGKTSPPCVQYVSAETESRNWTANNFKALSCFPS